MTATVTRLYPRRVPEGPRWPKTDRTQGHKTVDGVRLFRYGRGWRVDGSWIGMEKLDGRRYTVLVPDLPPSDPNHEFLATTLPRAIRALRERGLLPAPPEGDSAA